MVKESSDLRNYPMRGATGAQLVSEREAVWRSRKAPKIGKLISMSSLFALFGSSREPQLSTAVERLIISIKPTLELGKL